MSAYLLISSNTIQNIIEWDGTSQYVPPTGMTLVQYNGVAGVGWSWDGNTATDPNPPIVTGPTYLPPPISVTAAQGRLALLDTPNTANTSQNMLEVVNNAVIASGNAGLQVFWEYAPNWDINNQYVTAMANAVGLSSNAVTQLFQAAQGY